jgi:hypothetical protein
MSPARGFYDPAAFVEMMESSIAIGLEHAGEETQMLFGMFSLAILRVGEPHGPPVANELANLISGQFV